MATCLRDHPDVTLVTSHRRLIDNQGKLVNEIEATRRLVAEDSRVSGAWLIDEMLRKQQNYIGEPSTAMFRRADIQEIAPDFWTLGGINFMGNADVTVWISLLAQGDGIYLTESLSRFRLHPDQTSKDPTIHELCRAAWHRAVNGTSYLGLYDPATPAPLDATPLGDSPWWTPETRAHVATTRRALGEGDGATAMVSCDRALAAEPDDLRLEHVARALPGSDRSGAGGNRCPGRGGAAPSRAGRRLCEDGRDGVGHRQPRRRQGVVSGGAEQAGAGASHLGRRRAPWGVTPGPACLVRAGAVAAAADGDASGSSVAMPRPRAERPIRVVLSCDGAVAATGELTGLGATLALEASIPSRPTTTRLDLRWSGAVDVVPAPTDEPLALRLAGVEVYLATEDPRAWTECALSETVKADPLHPRRAR